MMLPFFPRTGSHGAGIPGTNSAGASPPILPPPARSRWWSPKDGSPPDPQKPTATVLKSRVRRDTLVLQFPLSSQAATAMACLGYLLVPTPPAGPANDLRWRVSRDPQEADQESTDLRVSEIWRYQPCQPRTS